MPRKFSFSLAPAKAPSKQPDKPAEPSPVEKSPHKRHASKDSVTTLNTVFCDRQRLDPRIEQELRAACALILQNLKPSDHDMPDADPKLDFRGPHTRRREHQTEPPTQFVLPVQVCRPTGAPAEQKNTQDARKDVSHRVANVSRSYPDLPMRANTGRRRAENTEMTQAEAEPPRRVMKSYTVDVPRQHIVRTDTADTDDVLSVGTPLTTSTDTHHYSHSTAPTSVAATHRSSKRTSRQGDGPAAIADAQAAEWMRQELEKRQQQLASMPQLSRPATSERPPSRASSIRSGIRDYIFPGSRSLSRQPSRTSLDSASSGQPKRRGSTRGWKSWGWTARTSSRNSSRPGTSSGSKDTREHDKKSEVNLNRELPPLPSLDTWKEPEQPKEQPKPKVKAPTVGPHIAMMMRPVEQQQQQDYAAAVRANRGRSGSDTLATHYAKAYKTMPKRVKSPTEQPSARSNPRLVPDERSMSFDHMVSALSTSNNLDEQLQFRVSEQKVYRRRSNASRMSADGTLIAPNFSRKISTDDSLPGRPFDASDLAYPNVVQITATHAQKPVREQKSKLKKMFSAWVLKKEKSTHDGDWMQKFEKEGIRTGVMTQDKAALPPVVRY